MRILLLTQWFDPEPTFKGLAFARELVAQGHEVEVLTAFPNYPGGKLYPGYRVRWRQIEHIDGIRVVRVPVYPSHDASGVRRAVNYLSFAVAAATIGTLSVQRPDVVYVYHPPATIGLSALALRARHGAPFVYDIQDLWPDTLGATGMLGSPRLQRLIGAWCQVVYRAAAHLVVLSPGFRERLVERGVHPDRITVIPNWCDEQQLDFRQPEEDAARRLGMDGRFNVVFAGTMGKAQALDAVLEVARLFRGRPEVQFIFVGGGIEVERLRAAAAPLENVRFLPRRPMAEMGEVLQLADVLLVHLKDDPLFAITIPSKTQAYMAAGRPVLMAVRGDAADLVRQAGAGLVSLPEQPEQMAQALEALLAMSREEREELGASGRRFYEHELSLRVGVTRFVELFARVARRRREAST